MPRISIELPPHFRFTTELQVLYGHLNPADHLDNAQLIGLLSEVRERFFNSLGYTRGEIDGVGIVVADAAVQYRSEAFRGETLVFAMDVQDFNRCGCDLVYRASEKNTGREVARGKTGIVFFDYSTRQVAPVPESFRERLDAPR
jgi:acyl-CoA thioester hydrolase